MFAATLDNIEARTARKELKGGIKAAFLPKKTRGGKVHLALHLHWGDEKALQNKGRAGSMMGVADEARHDEEVATRRSRISRTSSRRTSRSRQRCDRPHAPHRDHCATSSPRRSTSPARSRRAPAFPDKELDIVRQEQLARVEQQLQDPTAVAFNTLQQLDLEVAEGRPALSR